MSNTQTPWYQSYPEDVQPLVDVAPFRSINHLFVSVCKSHRRRTAFISFEHKLTYQQLSFEVGNLAAFLQQRCKLKRGDKLAIILPNILQYPVAVFAALKIGLIVVNINPLYTACEMQSVLKDCGAKAVIAFEMCARNLQEILSDTEVDHLIVTGLGDMLGLLKGSFINFFMRSIKRMVGAYDHSRVIPFKQALREGRELPCDTPVMHSDDVAFLQYTGGTTGKPKGAMLTHGNIIANVAQLTHMYGMVLQNGREVILTPLPIYHVFSMTVNLMLAFSLAVTNILVLDPRRMKMLAKIIRRHPDITLMTGVNTLYNTMLNHGLLTPKSLPQLKLAIGGGAAIQSGVAERFYQATGKHILEGYGLTECSPVTCVNPHTSHVYNGSIGIPLPNTLARIVDNQGQEIWDLNTPGELEFQGPQVMLGYFNKDQESSQVMDGKWLRTGDVAVWCEGGYLKIIDRIKDMIIVSGFNVYPSEIEDVVSQNNKILECACIGVSSEQTGEAIKLFIVKKDPQLTEQDVLDFCKQYLTGYKRPKIIEFVPRLPKSPVGKVMRRYLKQHRLTD
ncbi:MAG: AMP-binding protein [Succinivibrio sp.]|nr:AMP-binding protein [Succinivibrio sp.]